MMLTDDQCRTILAQNPQAVGLCRETGRPVFTSQLLGNWYVPGPDMRTLYASRPGDAPGARHCDTQVTYRWQLGLPAITT